MKSAGLGVVTALAGCSGGGSDGEGEPSPEDGDQPDSETQTEQSTDTESTTEQEQTETPTETSSSDTVYDGEEQLEEFIGSMSEVIEDEPDYYWIEFESPTEQINVPVESVIGEDRQFNYFVENGSFATQQGGEEYDIDAMYFTIPETGLETSPEVFAFSEEAWDEEASLRKNIQQNVYRRTGILNSGGNRADISEDDLEVLFSEDIQKYNDNSEDFPQKYLDLVD